MIKLLSALVLLAALAGCAAALSGRRPIEGGPSPLRETVSLGRIIASGAPVHIVFVHGMRAEGRNASEALRSTLARKYGASGADARVERELLDLGPWPAGAAVGTAPSAGPVWTEGDPIIWKSAAEWEASRPFVDRYRLVLPGGQTITIDEVNWWPLLFPIKCRFLLVPERALSGKDKKHLNLCASSDPEERFHPWITPQQRDQFLSDPVTSGGGAFANRWLKREIMNWGLADAVIALGPMRLYIARAMQAAFAYAGGGGNEAGVPVLVSESLGSFVVLDAYDRGAEAVKGFLERTHHLYFFANQFALLELGRIRGLDASEEPDEGGGAGQGPVPETAAPRPASALSALARWGAAPPPPPAAGEPVLESAGPLPKQIVAISDPSDVLTYRVPPIPGVAVANVYLRNAANYRLFAAPVEAHAGHAANPAVWKLLLDDTAGSRDVPQR